MTSLEEDWTSEAIADIKLDAAIWMLARLEFFRPTESRPIMLTKAKEKIPMARATSVRVKASWPRCCRA